METVVMRRRHSQCRCSFIQAAANLRACFLGILNDLIESTDLLNPSYRLAPRDFNGITMPRKWLNDRWRGTASERDNNGRLTVFLPERERGVPEMDSKPRWNNTLKTRSNNACFRNL
jgi:hypothetical protein